MPLAFSRVCSTLMIGGFAFGIPVHFYTKGSNSPTTINDISGGGRSTSSRAPTAQEIKFYKCLDESIKLKITNIKDKSEFEAPLSDMKKYSDRSKWTVDALYEGQCKQHNQK